MKKDIPTIGVIALFGVLLIGLGVLISKDMDQAMKASSECIAAGMQYIRGDCMK